MKPLLFLLALSLLAASCSDESSPPTSGVLPVEGYVHAGPTCPVVQDPPDPACADRPVAGAGLRILDAVGDPVTTVTTSADGTFVVLLSPGTYTLEPLPVDGLLGTPEPQSFDVGSEIVSLDVSYDTGIR